MSPTATTVRRDAVVTGAGGGRDDGLVMCSVPTCQCLALGAVFDRSNSIFVSNER